jgi:hypothetical protein
MVDWGAWEPGWPSAGERVRSMGVVGVAETARATGVPIDDLSPSQQESVVSNLDDDLQTGSKCLERRLRECCGDRERSHAVAVTLTAWAMTQDSLATYRANELGQWELLVEDGACPDCLAVAADNPHSVNDPRGVPPLHACCRCTTIPFVNVPGVDTSREALAPEDDEA